MSTGHQPQPLAPTTPISPRASTGRVAAPGRPHITLTAGQKILIGIVLLGAVAIAAIGFAGSYTAVRELAEEKGFGGFATYFPIGVDAGIVSCLALDLLLTWLRIPYPLLRQTAWLLTAATIAFNGAAAWGDPLGVAMHATIPVLFIVTIEAARNGIGRLAAITEGRAVTGPPARMWRVAPITAAIVWRTQTRLGVAHYQDVLDRRRDMHVYRARMRNEHGRRWRRDRERALPLKLARYGMTISEALDLPEQERDAHAEADHQRHLAKMRRNDERRREEQAVGDEIDQERQEREDAERRRAEKQRARAEQAARERRQQAEEEERERRLAQAEEQTRKAELAARERAARAHADAEELVAQARADAEERQLAAEQEARRREQERLDRVADAHTQAEVDRIHAERAQAEEAQRRWEREEAAQERRQLLREAADRATPRRANFGEPEANSQRTGANSADAAANPQRTTSPEPANHGDRTDEPNPDANQSANPAEPRRTSTVPASELTRELLRHIEGHGYWAVSLPYVQETFGLKKTSAHEHLRAARLAWGSGRALALIEEHGDAVGAERLTQLGMKRDLAEEAFTRAREIWEATTRPEPTPPPS